jgi:dolichol-phosphate mannosyltransferase
MATPEIPAAEALSPISPLILERWACPRCHDRRLQGSRESVQCPGCGAVFGNERGIPLFRSPPPAPDPGGTLDLTVVVLALNERENVCLLLPEVHRALTAEGLRFEVLLMDGGSRDGTAAVAAELGARVERQKRRGYGGAVAEALQLARGRYALMMDADLSHPVPFLVELWRARQSGDLVIASRYVPGARFDAPWIRKVLSRILNVTFTRLLSLPVHDVSSGFRLYRVEAFRDIPIDGTNFEALEEILIKAYLEGRRVGEIPFHYEPRREGRSKVHFIEFALCYSKTLYRMWALRSAMAGADYEDRAYRSRIPLQRYWQRARHRAVLRQMKDEPGVVLDVGCGSSRILQDLPRAVGVDVHAPKLRYLQRRGAAVLQGSLLELPFADGAFDAAVCSQVFEHLPAGPKPFAELARVLKPGGRAVVGTLDYGRPYWPLLERVYQWVHPDRGADEHVTHYTLASLRAHLEQADFDVLEHEHILGSELVVLARKRG